MALQIVVNYQSQPVTYEVTTQENEIYHLRLNALDRRTGKDYVPEKIIIRRKGKLWVSDNETYDDLIRQLTREITRFSSQEHI